ncbi:MAG: hypothetical protein M3P93_05365 [Actinomycetota bacterium]|nr:hypothetical protein [Actinomycetota bacterium]
MRLFSASGATATPLQRVSFGEQGLRERAHLQEWVVAPPEMLGEDLLIATLEFDSRLGPAGRPRAQA